MTSAGPLSLLLTGATAISRRHSPWGRRLVILSKRTWRWTNYMFHILKEYAKLLKFKPTMPEKAVELYFRNVGPRHVFHVYDVIRTVRAMSIFQLSSNDVAGGETPPPPQQSFPYATTHSTDHTYFIPFYHYLLPLVQLINTHVFIKSLLTHPTHYSC